jgi:hypothetical protein
MNTYIRPHLGLGDHIICNGLVRHFCEISDHCVIPSKIRNIESVSDMLSDVSNVTIIPVDNISGDDTANMLSNHFKSLEYHVVTLGNYNSGFLSNDDSYDMSFYRQAGVDFDVRWTKFKYTRCLERERNLFNKMCGEGNEGKYIFIHDDPSRNQLINREFCNKNFKEVVPGINGQHSLHSVDNGRFFDYSYILENAAEIHCVESAFAILTDHLDLSKTQRYIHRYVRNVIVENPKLAPTYRNTHTLI